MNGDRVQTVIGQLGRAEAEIILKVLKDWYRIHRFRCIILKRGESDQYAIQTTFGGNIEGMSLFSEGVRYGLQHPINREEG